MPADRDTLLALAARVEGAEGPSRELDGGIWRAVNGYQAVDGFHCDGVWHRLNPKDAAAFDLPPAYTASLDAALALVPEGFEATITVRPPGRVSSAICYGPGSRSRVRDAATPALALTAAALRARAEGRG